jgi:glycosyltransferase involved in cell wall biosynthesis
MAAYNGEKFLEQQLQSLSKQTRLPAALIVCDDTSSDATADIIKRFSETAPFPVKLVVNEQRLGWRGNFLKSGLPLHFRKYCVLRSGRYLASREIGHCSELRFVPVGAFARL